MKKWLMFVILVVIGLVGFVFQILYSGGFFREVLPKNTDKIVQSLRISGAEDIAISREGAFLIVSSDDRTSRRDGMPIQGGLYYINLSQAPFSARLLDINLNRPFYPHGISLLKLDSGYQLLVINHVKGEHMIEKFVLHGDKLTFVETLRDPSMVSPNDVIALSENTFYFTNDHHYAQGFWRTLEDYLGLRKSGVVLYDNNGYQEVATGIAYANGINIDTERKLLFVASPRDFLVKVYQMNEDNSLSFVEDIPADTGVDNIEFDEDGSLWIGCHPNLLTFGSYAQGKQPFAPSEIIRINYRSKGDYDLTSFFVDEGQNLSASTVAVPYQGQVFVGTVMDEKVLVLDID